MGRICGERNLGEASTRSTRSHWQLGAASQCHRELRRELRPVVDKCIAASKPALVAQRSSSPDFSVPHLAGLGIRALDHELGSSGNDVGRKWIGRVTVDGLRP